MKIKTMKKLLLFMSVLLLTSCATDKYLLSTEEMEKSPYRTEGNKVMKGDEVIGKVSSTEIEIDKKGNRTQEISITLTGFDQVGEADEVIKFLHTKYPNKKIEVNLDGVQSFE
jgi:hypothetical protein